MLTIQSALFLRKLKKVQISESNWIMLDSSQMGLSLFLHENPNEHSQTLNLEKYRYNWQSILSYLKENGYVLYDAKPMGNAYAVKINVTHQGWHFMQNFGQMFLLFLFRSILVPIIVAFFTALITA